jgi:predicted RNase H-like nuclease (RuvC/YqgF family)
MTNEGAIISGIDLKLRKLIAQYVELREKNENYQAEIRELTGIIEDQKKLIHTLEEKVKTIKLTKTLETKEGAGEAKTRINELVREIDKCIGLLNT